MCIGTLAVKKVSRNDVLQVMFVYMISTCNLTVRKVGSQFDFTRNLLIRMSVNKKNTEQ